ncbi:hypothetical protein L1D35_19805 [Vibrio harveyi]|uniref:hypothetical protein n=1 Tax=Vibrio harveyi TaxID=669 RepID=UPI001EFD12A1|nr:hypothetical protein [Vibrio harveyi]MCG9589956.1 hypothetical protein [Vibrio harveyi]MCG9670255.1 hypothetical protein [Vibrio harveyi]
MRGLLLMLGVFSFSAIAGQKVILDVGKVIPIQVPTGKDVVLTFNEGQMVGVGPSAEKFLAVESISQRKQVTFFGRDLTVKPLEVQFRGLDTNHITKVSVEVVERDDVPLNLSIEKERQNRNLSVDTTTKRNTRAYSDYWDAPEFKKNISLHDFDEKAALLVRYVNQYYGPRYAQEKTPFSIRKISSFKPQKVERLYRRGYLAAVAKEVFYGGGMTAIVFELENRSLVNHQFNPLNVRGDFWTLQPWKRNYEVGEKGVLVYVIKGRLDRGMFKSLGERVQ